MFGARRLFGGFGLLRLGGLGLGSFVRLRGTKGFQGLEGRVVFGFGIPAPGAAVLGQVRLTEQDANGGCLDAEVGGQVVDVVLRQLADGRLTLCFFFGLCGRCLGHVGISV